MNSTRIIGSTIAVSAFFSALSLPLAAQNVLYVEYSGKPRLVEGAEGTKPRIELNGKLTTVDGHNFALQKIDEYLPVFVTVRDLQVRSTYDTVDGAGQVNNTMYFTANFETSFRLKNVFLLLDLSLDQAGKVYFLYEVGRLEPNQTKPLSLTVPLASPLGSGQFHFHLFVAGAEALHSEISFFEREASLRRMIEARIANVQDAAPKPFIGPAPEYPASLLKSGVKGQAVITIRIRSDGSIQDPVVKSASDPAFGETALGAAREWRFLPRVKDGYPVESVVEMPFLFEPPEKS